MIYLQYNILYCNIILVFSCISAYAELRASGSKFFMSFSSISDTSGKLELCLGLRLHLHHIQGPGIAVKCTAIFNMHWQFDSTTDKSVTCEGLHQAEVKMRSSTSPAKYCRSCLLSPRYQPLLVTDKP